VFDTEPSETAEKFVFAARGSVLSSKSDLFYQLIFSPTEKIFELYS